MMKMQALQNISEYLLDAESQMATDNNSNNVVNYSVDGGHSVPIAAGPEEANSMLAHHLLMNMNEKYFPLYASKFWVHGGSSENSNPKVQLKVPDSMKGKFDNGSFNYARLGVSRIHKLIRGNRVSRNKFM
ncbi:Sister chromatid cohesion protein SCC2 [Camellia lanceoleosa]|uniref:Sister chromatid cohesion protein SCC2 n=1 Tax=Camellia lanceoleosa TaxID=1840588 RepID=A0ACC0HKH6_9ERIC|nr:Sister chromatid cohesion protein SCC2 [Camellia lanceoleosa]